jgi:sucrose phosphorylase
MTMRLAPRRADWRRLDHLEEPDFSRPPEPLSEPERERLLARLRPLYGSGAAEQTLPELERLVRVHRAHKTEAVREAERGFDPRERFGEKDLMLITYGDMVRTQGRSGLAALGELLSALREGESPFSILHVLPFFPYTSDRGFSVVDFHAVNPRLGSWDDVRRLGESCRLMFDGVLNHASASSAPFQQMFRGNPDFADYALCFRSPDELRPEERRVLRRPRTSDVLSQFDSMEGPLWVWTTFSRDQIDLNYHNPRVLLGAVETLLHYVRRGADLVRLDAVTYLWKERGTPSASLDETHAIVKLFREVLDVAAPMVGLVTESNVPHAENVSYFGDGSDEAQLVYNFALPPLVLHAFYRGDATWLASWAEALEYPPGGATFLNILDTHDGIGLPGAEGILPPREIAFLVETARRHGAFVSYRSGAASEVPYEINSTWYSALNLENTTEPRALQVRRFAASRSIALALRGVPAVYLHSLAGTRNQVALALETKVKRDVNRSTLDLDILRRNLADPRSKLHHLDGAHRPLLRARVATAAFHPGGGQRVLRLSPALFSLLRTSPAGDERVVCLTNVTGVEQAIEVPAGELGVAAEPWYDLLGGRGWLASGGRLRVAMGPYEVVWLTPAGELERRIASGEASGPRAPLGPEATTRPPGEGGA